MKRNNVSLLLSVLTVVVLLSGCHAVSSKATTELEEARVAIIKSNDIYFQSFVKGDSSIFIDRYAKDCCIMAPGIPAMCGEGAAASFFRTAYDQIGLRNGKFTITQIYGSGNGYVTEEGLWESFDVNNKRFDDGKYLVLWKKTANGWKMFRDSFSSNHQ